ncbi:glutaredoxin family protein [Photobacterium leiognathi]|uniref:glutaredoxin family protein n=1 Tax=Photobacterium leiognathi TaxID=553611 RepID=UPI002735C37C|nr:glutaredoxin family protein [Photobacterium leiognathi]
MKRIVLFSQKSCSNCKDAQQYMASKSYSYRLVDISSPKGRKEFNSTGARSVPVLRVGDQVLIGWNMTKFEKALKSKD